MRVDSFGIQYRLRGNGVVLAAWDRLFAPDLVGPGHFARVSRSGTATRAAVTEALADLFKLVRRGKVSIEMDREARARCGDMRDPHRVVGISRDGKRVWLVTADGRQPGSSGGVAFPGLARLIPRLHAYVATNLNGGESTTIVAGDSLLNRGRMPPERDPWQTA